MFKILNKRLKRFCLRFQWPIRRRSKPKIIIQKFGRSNSKSQNGTVNSAATTMTTTTTTVANGSATVYPNTHFKPIKIATFNAALFSMAPVIPKSENSLNSPNSPRFRNETEEFDKINKPKSILKQSPVHPISTNCDESLSKQQKFSKSRLRVSINLPDNEISLLKSRQWSFREDENLRISKGKAPLRSQSVKSVTGFRDRDGDRYRTRSSKTVLEVLKELDADVLALQDVKAEEEKEMKPLSDLASALGMFYVFAESWAPEYGNAILSKWPIKRWKVQKIFDDSDFRNVLKATIVVPQTGEVDIHCTLLDHLDENWRMKQINSIIQSSDGPHILAGGLNSLDETDYSKERWGDIVKYYEEMGKPMPKAEVMRFLKSKHYTDAKDYAGECESVVMIAKGQNVQGTCKYGTRVDYILTSPSSPYKFVPGSYAVFSSKGTSDHHIVKVEIVKAIDTEQKPVTGKRRPAKQPKVVKITNSTSSKGIWKLQS